MGENEIVFNSIRYEKIAIAFVAPPGCQSTSIDLIHLACGTEG